MNRLHKAEASSRWDQMDRAHRLSGAPPQREYVKGRLGMSLGSGLGNSFGFFNSPSGPGGPGGFGPALPPYQPPKLPPPTGPQPPYHSPKFRPLIDPKRVPFGRPPSPNPTPFRPALTPKGLGMLLRWSRPLPLTALFLLLDVLPFGRGTDPGHDFSGTGWTLWCDDGLGPLVMFTSATNNPNLPCPTGGQVPSGGYNGTADIPIPTGHRWFALGRSQLGGIRMRLDQQWHRPAPWPGGSIPYHPTGAPGPYTWPDALPWPLLDPKGLPILKPAPTPRPIPYPLLPHRPPNPETGPMPETISPRPRRVRRVGNGIPTFEIPITPDPDTGRPRPDRPRPSVHVRRPPNPREREKKYVIGVNKVWLLAKLIGALTEFADLLDVAWKSLPRSIRNEYIGANRITKLAVLLQNLEHVEPGSFVALYLSDQLEDTAFGKLGKIGAKAAREAFKDLKGSVGLQTGPADTPPAPNVPGSTDWIGALDQWMGENIYAHTIGNTSWKGWF